MTGVLILCGTPIGNLGDAPPRLAEALEGADCVYAEDTRRSAKLLSSLGVRPRRMRSYFAGNEEQRSRELAGRLSAGETVALVTDAGTPGISDPGISAVRSARATGSQVTIVPGPSAVTAALAVSGLSATRFAFEGFLPRSGKKRARRIQMVSSATRTVVLFSSPHHLVSDLSDLVEAGMATRALTVVRELTKMHEEIWAGTMLEALGEWQGRTRQGEFTLVIGAGEESEAIPASPGMDKAAEGVRRLVAEGLSTSAAVKEVARLLGVSRRDLYQSVHR